MKKETYLKMTQPFRENPKLAKSLHISNCIITGLIFVSYPLLLIWMFLEKDEELLRSILVPLDGFILVSVLRYMVNRPRPYEKFGIPSVIPKNTKGKSFPSRHVFSAAVIALTFLMQPECLVAGIGLLFLTAAISVIRVVSGVHFISDVLAALIAAVLMWLIGIYVF
ncbi:MAG: phosphatase PAP2 family protein [Lachnospiraceae bacterium]|nr:phosphatase PAP2 family protein [Agathobacter sp.]MDD6291911.1 phosphatase PAP2 family protein [Lachnospiraceae bacterium]